MDPRIGKKALSNIMTNQKIYSKDNGFTAIASNKAGEIATASE